MWNKAKPIPSHEALRVADADARRVYRDLSPYRIGLLLQDEGWHIDYRLLDPGLQGGGPHYIIDSNDGRILKKRYEQ